MGKIIYQNEVLLRGIVQDKVSFKKSKNGKMFCSFALSVNTDERYVSETDTNGHVFVMILAVNYKKNKIVDILKANNFRRGLYVKVKGRLVTSTTEIKGKRLMRTAVKLKEISYINSETQEETPIIIAKEQK